MIGDNVAIGDGTIICVANFLRIGNDSMIAVQCYITDANHGMYENQLMRLQHLSIKETWIGENVWIGSECKILSEAKVANSFVLGSSIVATDELQENMIYIGNCEVEAKRRKQL